MSYPPQGAGGIAKLSQLIIDGDKDWAGKGVTNIKQLAAGMVGGSIIVKGLGGILENLPPGILSRVLTSNGLGALPSWQPGGTYFNRFFPAELFGIPSAALKTPEQSRLITALLQSPALYMNDAAQKTPTVAGIPTAGLVVPTGSAAITAAMGATTITSSQRYTIMASGDDCFRYYTGGAWVFSIVATTGKVGYQDATHFKQGVAFRFLLADVPNAATIDSAVVRVYAPVTRTDATVNSRVEVQDSDDAAIFSTDADYAARPRVAGGGVHFDGIPQWAAGTWYDLPDVKVDVQHVINHAGWAAGNHIVIFWTDELDESTHSANAMREITEWDSDKFKAARLTLTWH